MYMPPEWLPHRTCLILYPHNTQVFRSVPLDDGTKDNNNNDNDSDDNDTRDDHRPLHKCGPARAEVRNVARAILEHGGEDVLLLCNTQDDAAELERTLLLEEEAGNAVAPLDAGTDGVVLEQPLVEGRRKGRIGVEVCPSDDSWCRDTGPTFVYGVGSESMTAEGRRRLIGLDWKFNAYGGPEDGCYWPCTKDQAVARNVLNILNRRYNNDSPSTTNDKHDHDNNNNENKISHLPVDIILEGGSFHTDGDGTILTTEECLLHPNRNPSITKPAIEALLLHHLGATKVIWLPCGLAFDDDTNGHVDNIATFVRPGEVVLGWTDEGEEVEKGNYERCRLAEEVLKGSVDAGGRRIKVHRLYLPRPMFYTAAEVEGLSPPIEDNDTATPKEEAQQAEACERMTNQPLAASYVNYYLANDAVVLPQFGDAVYDARAQETMEEIFPERKVVGVYSREILLGGGNIHCITQQVPMI